MDLILVWLEDDDDDDIADDDVDVDADADDVTDELEQTDADGRAVVEGRLFVGFGSRFLMLRFVGVWFVCLHRSWDCA